MILPGATIGLLGGGQLGRMIALEARRLGYKTVALDPTPDSPAGQVCDEQIVAPVGDAAAAERLARRCDVVTLEWELIPAPALEKVASLRPLHPGPRVLEIIADRLTQKEFLKKNGFPQARYLTVDGPDALGPAAEKLGYPVILKRRREGYDGKGQARLSGPQALAAARETALAPCVLEATVPFIKEVSVILARREDGATAVYPLAENAHRGGVLHTTVAPARVPAKVERHAVELGLEIAEALGHVGVLAVEMFLLEGGELLVNEIAPRVHNSGHYTLGACATSQFEQHLRAVCGLALGETRQLCPAVMLNLLGDLWRGGEPRWEAALERPEARLHLYGKAKAAPGRKMGHLLLLGLEAEPGLALAEELHEALRAPSRV